MKLCTPLTLWSCLLLPPLTAGCGAADLAKGCLEPMSQTLSQPCCPDHGIDACGATLVCAALDDRTQSTCYPEHSRPDGAECTDDRLCASGSCDLDASRCKSALGARCDQGVGCADDPLGFEVQCLPQEDIGQDMCQRRDLPDGVPCYFSVECLSDRCVCNRGGVVTCCS